MNLNLLYELVILDNKCKLIQTFFIKFFNNYIIYVEYKKLINWKI